MSNFKTEIFFDSNLWLKASHGPRYVQLARHIQGAISNGQFPPESQLPPEREISSLSGVSRVTVRKAIARLVEEGSITQLQGSGSYVKKPDEENRLEQSLSTLTSFTEYMQMRGIVSESQVLSSGTYPPSPDEMVTLGLASDQSAARIKRLRTADGVPMAIESSSVPSDILPNPQSVETSLYDVLRKTGVAPVRAIQRITATNLRGADADLMGMPAGAALLQIDRTGYLASGRPVEFTRGIYRSDIYDFVAELNLEERPE